MLTVELSFIYWDLEPVSDDGENPPRERLSDWC